MMMRGSCVCVLFPSLLLRFLFCDSSDTRVPQHTLTVVVLLSVREKRREKSANATAFHHLHHQWGYCNYWRDEREERTVRDGEGKAKMWVTQRLKVNYVRECWVTQERETGMNRRLKISEEWETEQSSLVLPLLQSTSVELKWIVVKPSPNSPLVCAPTS